MVALYVLPIVWVSPVVLMGVEVPVAPVTEPVLMVNAPPQTACPLAKILSVVMTAVGGLAEGVAMEKSVETMASAVPHATQNARAFPAEMMAAVDLAETVEERKHVTVVNAATARPPVKRKSAGETAVGATAGPAGRLNCVWPGVAFVLRVAR